MEKVDRRVIKSRQAIQTVFLQMLYQEGLSKRRVVRMNQLPSFSVFGME